MRIIIATSSNYLAFHGQAIFTINLAEGLAQNGHNVMVVAGSDRGHSYNEQLNGVRLEALRAISLKLFHPDSYLTIFPSLFSGRLVDSFKPDIVHIQDHYPLSRSMVIAAKAREIRLVGTNHFMPENLAPYFPMSSKIKTLFTKILWEWMKEVYGRLDAVVCPSITAAEMLKDVGITCPVYSISCGVNTGNFYPNPSVDRLGWRHRYGIKPESIVFFFVGRIDREKRLDVMIKAIQKINRDDIQLVIGGNGAEKSTLISIVNELNLKNKVIFTGFIPNSDLPSLLNSIDIFAMPSEAELLSIASLQAMACARPMLVANAVALPELVTEDQNGLLFQPGNVDDAARCIKYLAETPSLWQKMGECSLERARPHDLQNIIRRYEELYQKVIIQ
jgi:1,2-diacylglycerol 3-alpha-glucosyltransferase